jgi:hypothetical protein
MAVSEALEIFFYNSAVLNHPNTLAHVIALFEDTGFDLKKFESGDFEWLWSDPDSNHTEALRTAYADKGCSFSAYNRDWQLEVFQELYWDVEELGGADQCYICTLTDNTPYFWLPEYHPAQYSSFYLNLAKGLYDLLQPTFGWVDFHTHWATTHEDVRNVKLPTIYWATFLGLPYVVRLGREHILRAPAGKAEVLGDGGILYTLSSCPGPVANSLQDEQTDVVKAHFQVERVRP